MKIPQITLYHIQWLIVCVFVGICMLTIFSDPAPSEAKQALYRQQADSARAVFDSLILPLAFKGIIEAQEHAYYQNRTGGGGFVFYFNIIEVDTPTTLQFRHKYIKLYPPHESMIFFPYSKEARQGHIGDTITKNRGSIDFIISDTKGNSDIFNIPNIMFYPDNENSK